MPKTKQLIEERPEDKARTPHGPKSLTKDGREIMDPVPMAPPVGYKKQPSIFENMRKLIHDERVLQSLRDQGQETFEEADDFDVEDELDPKSPYEGNFEPVSPADRAALRREPINDDDPELRRLVEPQSGATRSTKSPAGMEGGAGGSPDPLPDPPAGHHEVNQQRGRFFRRNPSKPDTE